MRGLTGLLIFYLKGEAHGQNKFGNHRKRHS